MEPSFICILTSFPSYSTEVGIFLREGIFPPHFPVTSCTKCGASGYHTVKQKGRRVSAAPLNILNATLVSLPTRLPSLSPFRLRRGSRREPWREDLAECSACCALS